MPSRQMLVAYHICSIEYILWYILPLHIPARAVGKTSNSDGAARDFDVILSSSPAAVSATFTATILCATLPIKLCIIEVHDTHGHMKFGSESSNLAHYSLAPSDSLLVKIFLTELHMRS